MSANYNELDRPNDSFQSAVVIDQYALKDVNLITPSATISLKALMIEISYYEDIFNPATSGYILLNDSISLIERAGLCGNEFIQLTFERSDKASKQAEFSRYFRVYRVGERLLENHSTETYKLNFCSEELFLSEQIKVSKSYKNKKVSEIIEDILKNYLKIPQKRLNIDESDGLYDLIVPFKKPFEAINWMTNLAQPLGYEGADYLFFENQDGFNFLSLQKLFKKQVYTSYIYNPNNAGNFTIGGITTTELGRSLVGIKSYKFLDTFDSLYGTVTGSFANKTLVINPLTRSFKEIKYDYKDYFKRSEKLNKEPVISDVKNRLGKYPHENYDSVFKVVYSNMGDKKAQYLKDNPSGVANDIMAEVFIPYRTAQKALMTYSRIKLSLTGDPQLSVGKVVQVYLPSNVSRRGEMGYNEGMPNPYSTGKYIVTSVRHIIDVNMRYEMIAEVAKDSYSDKFTSNEINKDFLEAKKGNK